MWLSRGLSDTQKSSAETHARHARGLINISHHRSNKSQTETNQIRLFPFFRLYRRKHVLRLHAICFKFQTKTTNCREPQKINLSGKWESDRLEILISESSRQLETCLLIKFDRICSISKQCHFWFVNALTPTLNPSPRCVDQILLLHAFNLLSCDFEVKRVWNTKCFHSSYIVGTRENCF